jgi:hypothetical protein
VEAWANKSGIGVKVSPTIGGGETYSDAYLYFEPKKILVVANALKEIGWPGDILDIKGALNQKEYAMVRKVATENGWKVERMNTRRNPPTTRPQTVPRSAGKVSKRLKVRNWLGRTYSVDGEAVSRAYTPFSGGAHHLWARFVPRYEFWIDSRLGSAGRFIAAHEWFESMLMNAKGWKYEKAHNAANALERDLRKAWDNKSGKGLTIVWYKHLMHHHLGLPVSMIPWANHLAASLLKYR